MRWLLLCRMLGALGILIGAAMTLSLPWAFPAFGQASTFEADGFWGLVGAIATSLLVGGVLTLLGRGDDSSILRKEALAVVGLSWVMAGILGALPYLYASVYRAPDVPMTVADALFESISGFTTTGASVLTDVENPELVPRCILFWRSFTHWLGGMGIVVLFVAILAQLGAGGKALMRREVPGPITEGVRPRVRETALTMWTIYVVMSVVLTALLMIEGVSLYNALCHTFGTLATGGFSTFNDSIGHFDGWIIEATIVVFMVLAATNFSLYFLVARRSREQARSIGEWFTPLLRDVEYRGYLLILTASTIVISVSLLRSGLYETWAECLRHAAFMSVTIMTTTGYGTEDFAQWTEFSKGVLLLLMFVGGCAGSTGGGIKVIRVLLFAKVLWLELERAFRPNVVRPLRIGGATVDETIRRDVVTYFGFVTIIFALGWISLISLEPDTPWKRPGADATDEKLLDCASAVAATFNNIGPGLGVLGPKSNYASFSYASKLVMCLLMLLGRLEIFAILVLILPSFWRTQ